MKQTQKRKPRRRNDGLPQARVVRSPPVRAEPSRPSRARMTGPFVVANDNAADAFSFQRLKYTAAGAAGTALTGSILAKQGWAPKTIAGTLTAVGAGLAWKGDGEPVRSVGAGVMSAAGSQLALMMIDDHEEKKAAAAAPPAKKPSNANDLPPGALQAAIDRARMRLAWTEEQQNAVLDAA
jgi:hypothetical protein